MISDNANCLRIRGWISFAKPQKVSKRKVHTIVFGKSGGHIVVSLGSNHKNDFSVTWTPIFMFRNIARFRVRTKTKVRVTARTMCSCSATPRRRTFSWSWPWPWPCFWSWPWPWPMFRNIIILLGPRVHMRNSTLMGTCVCRPLSSPPCKQNSLLCCRSNSLFSSLL